LTKKVKSWRPNRDMGNKQLAATGGGFLDLIKNVATDNISNKERESNNKGKDV
jgi:hypothetical protein